jgi:glucose/arabinose dehydrogenase
MVPFLRRRRFGALVGLIVGLVCVAPTVFGGADSAVAASTATQLPPGFAQTVVASGLVQPTSVAFLPDGRILIAEKSGLVLVYKNGALLPTPFIDFRSKVNTVGDRGMYAIAADPHFAANHYVYLLYVYDSNPTNPSGPKTGRLSRVTATGDTASPSTEVVLDGTRSGAPCAAFPVGSDCIPAEFRGHSTGDLVFAGDGTIFASLGDGSTWLAAGVDALRAQNLDSLAGKIIHVSATGKGLPSNPFWNGNPSSARSKVWAYGFRNAYRFTVRPGKTTIYAGDVGWSTTEEVDVVQRGGDYGWPCYEGVPQQGGYAAFAVCQSLYAQGPGAVQRPLITWDHNGSGAAVTGGAFYTGRSYPSDYSGAYFYGDYIRSFIRYVQMDSNNHIVGGPFDFATGADGPVDIVTGPNGDLYYLAINVGQLRRIGYVQTRAPGRSTYLASQRWHSATNGQGPIKRSGLLLDGIAYRSGLGVHAPADVHYGLNRQCTFLDATVGIDDSAGGGGSVDMRVLADGAVLYDSGPITGATPAATIHVPLTGKNDLELQVTDGGDGNVGDDADWANARTTCADATPPTVTGVSPADGEPDADLDTAPAATFSEPLDAGSVSTTTATLTAAGSPTPVPATVAYDAASRRIVLTPSASLDPATTYTARVVGGVDGVADLAGNPLAADRTWSFTTTSQPRTYLSDLHWTSMTNGLGPVELDESNGSAAAGDGTPLTLRGTVYPKGLGTRAPSEVRYALGGDCTGFRADVGIDDSASSGGTVDFKVLGDGATLADSGPLTRASAPVSLSADLTGVSELRLVVTGTGAVSRDLADWASARVTCSAGAPTVTIAQPTSALTYAVGDSVGYSGSATDADGHAIPAANLGWEVLAHHCSAPTCKVDESDYGAGASGSFVAPDAGDTGYLELVLKATDALGRTASASVLIQPRTKQLTIATSPAGLSVSYQGGAATVGPIMRTVPVGATRSVAVTSPQGPDSFVSWSDGGTMSHTLVMPSSDTTVTARFVTGTAPPLNLFADPLSFPVGTNPHSVVAADVNRDGRLDLVTANAGSDDTSVLLGNGDGTFQPAKSWATGPHPKFTGVADFNGDGKLDLATGNQDDDTDTVRLGNGNGTFSNQTTTYPACHHPHNVATGDLNGDGKPDIVTGCSSGSTLTVLLGTGKGTFAPTATYSTDASSYAVSIGDLNGDGHPDLAVAGYSGDEVAVLLGNGDGTFGAPQTFAVGHRPHSIAIADLNKDGKPDLLTADSGADTVSVLLGDGTGGFGSATQYAVGPVPKSIAAGDLNGDGNVDVVVGNTAGNGDGVTNNPNGDNVSVLLGNGDGTLGPAVTYRCGHTPFSVAIGDFNGDGRPDLATANWDDNAVGVLINAGAALGP